MYGLLGTYTTSISGNLTEILSLSVKGNVVDPVPFKAVGDPLMSLTLPAEGLKLSIDLASLTITRLAPVSM